MIFQHKCDSGLMGRPRYRLMMIPFLIGAIGLASCGKGRADEKGKLSQMAAPILAGTVIEKDVPVIVNAIGTVLPYTTVSVKSQITGTLQKIHFTEGEIVHEGDLLFTIDPRPYKAALELAKANLARDVAQHENAKSIATRDEDLLKKGLASQEEFDRSRTNAVMLANSVAADRAAAKNAKLQLSYCYIHSPITGKTGNILLQKGNIIKANDTVTMLVINQIQPVFVDFTVPSQYFNEIKSRMDQEKLQVTATSGQKEATPEVGVLTFIDNAVDTTTGTIHLKGTFDNEDMNLWPGQFANVNLKLASRPNAIIVQSRAINPSQAGPYVFVIKQDMTVEMRSVTVEFEIEGDSVIKKGLNAGEQVVTDGQIRLVPGSKVQIKSTAQGK